MLSKLNYARSYPKNLLSIFTKIMKSVLALLISMVIFSSCEKNIDFELKEATDLLVVDASIENGQAPVVILTQSFSFFSQISPVLLARAFVHGAEVFMSNGISTHKLREYSIDSAAGFRIYFYSIDTAQLASAFLGQLDKTYSLMIKAGGKEYTANTSIPILAKKPDTLFWIPAPLNPDTNKVILRVRATDPPGLGNYVRYYTKKNKGPFLPGENSVYDDQFIDGTTYEIRVDPGVDRNNMIPYEDNYFRKGDTVTLKISNIDKATYRFWSTMEFAYQSIGNPFASPGKVTGNISNGALGAFCGYASASRTLIIR